MQLTAQLKFQTTPSEADALRRTLERTNEACNYISECAWDAKTFRQYDLHKLCYRAVRDRFGLDAQVTVRAISRLPTPTNWTATSSGPSGHSALWPTTPAS